MNVRIFFFIGSMFGGGAERVISILANHYAGKGWNVEIVLLLNNRVEYELNPKIKIIDLTQKKKSYVKSLPFWLYQIRKYVKETKPDRIVSFIGRINILVLTACMGLNVPIIVSERNDPRLDGRGKFTLWYCNWCYRQAKSIIFQTQYAQSCFSRRLEEKSVIIPNPIHISVKPQEPEGYEIVTAGRLMQQKNHEMLINAFSKVKEAYPQASLKIYGEGALKEILQKQIDSMGLHESVILCGNVDDLHERIVGKAAFVLTSEFEGLSNALLEAMMLGLPCISTDYSGVDEIMEDGVNGIIVPKNDIDKLAKKIIYLLKEKDVRQEIVNNARKKSQKFEMDSVIKTWNLAIEGKIGEGQNE